MSLGGEHWYDALANSAHRIVGKNGKERATNIRDARERHLFPSVTTKLAVLAKPELDDWKHRQITTWCFNYAIGAAVVGVTAPSLEDFHARAIEGAFQQVEDAADLGTRIHEAIECHYTGKPWDQSLKSYVDAVDGWVKDHEIEFVAHELRLVNKAEGYAGTTDAEVRRGGYPDRGILDFKSRKTKPEHPVTPWSGQAAQIAAYHVARFGEIKNDDFGVNVFISTTEPGRIEAAWYDAATLRREWEFFLHAAAIWRHVRNYDPRRPG